MTPMGEGVGVRWSVFGGCSMRVLLVRAGKTSQTTPSTVVLFLVCPLTSVTYNPSLSLSRVDVFFLAKGQGVIK